MKKSILLILIMAAFTLFSNAQIINMGDFESGELGAWGSWGAPVAVVANPNTTGNSSAQCGSLDQSGGAWNGFRNWSDNSLLSSSLASISVDVYMSIGGTIQLYMDNSASGAANFTNAKSNVPANTWTNLVFDISKLTAYDYNQIAFQSDITGVILFDNIKMTGGEKVVIAKETFGIKAFDTNNTVPQASGWGSGSAWHFDWTDCLSSLTSTNGYITAGSDSSLRLNNYDDTFTKPEYWEKPSGNTHAHLSIRDGDAYKGSWDTLVYSNINISQTYAVTSIEFGYSRARTLSADTLTHQSLNVEYSIDGGAWIQADMSVVNTGNAYGKWDYIVIPVTISGSKLDVRFACVQPNEQIYLDDISIVGLAPSYPLMAGMITKETFGIKAFDTNNTVPQASGWGSGSAWHFDWTDCLSSLTSTNGYITAGSDSSLRLNNYDDTFTKPEYWEKPSGNIHAHLAIRDGDAYKGSWDTLVFTGINIADAFSVSSIEFGYARARTLSADTLTHQSLNVEYRIDGGSWIQADMSVLITGNAYGKWDYIVIPVNLRGKLLDVRFACVQGNEQIYLDDIAIMGLVQAPEGVNDFVAETVVVGTVDSPDDFTCNINLKWDADNMNIIFDIVDDSIVNTGTSYQVDNIEVYFDMDNSKNIHWPRNGGWMASIDPSWDANDFQFRLVPDVDFVTNNTTFKVGGIVQVYTKTNKGYKFELTVPWDSLMADFEPEIGTQIGFDVLVSDNDASASDANRNQITFVSSTDKPYNDASMFGTLQFEGMGTFNLIPDEEAPTVATNLAAAVDQNKVTLSWDNATDNIAILYYNVFQGGVMIKEKLFPKETGNTLVVKDLANGDYTFSFETVDNHGNVSATKASVNATVLVSSANEMSSRISVYPNPATNVLNIKGMDNIEKVEILGITGNIIKSLDGSNEINVTELSRGAYILKVHSNKEVSTTRFIKN